MTFALLLLLCRVTTAPPTDTPLDSLQPGQIVHGFETRAVYLNGADRPFGARFIHRATGFTLDLLRMESMPQGLIWVTAPPTSEMGEPHTQEHLLLNMGNKGRAVANLDSMSLADGWAWTAKWRTGYVFYTRAGPEVFLRLFERHLDGLRHPDYTDEEIRRVVRNFGVTASPGGSLKLVEKGQVYNEMLSYVGQPDDRLYNAFHRAVYGPDHPMAFCEGGLPEGLRALRPEQIRAFHAAYYHLANMGMIGVFPKAMTLGPTLSQLDTTLVRLQGGKPRRPARSVADLPSPRPAPQGQIQIVEYPHKNEQQPGLVYFGWPAGRKLDPLGFQLLSLFLDTIAGDATTNLYKRFVGSRTREVDIGARSVGNDLSHYPGHPVFISLTDVTAAHIREDELAQLRRRVREELARIAAWPDGSADLAEFNARARERVAEIRRNLARSVSSPPELGPGGALPWMYHLDRLAETKAFRKSATLKPELAAIEKSLSSGRNFWGDALRRWKMLDTEPYVLAARANPALIEQDAAVREVRISAETRRLVEKYGAANEQEALRRYQADYDKSSAEIDAAAARLTPPHFIDNPPLGLDEQLDYTVTRLPGGVPLVAATFESIPGAHAGLALRLDSVPEGQLIYLSSLAQVLTRVGVIENGKPVSYEQMTERQRREIYYLYAYLSSNRRTGRVELSLHGAGSDAAESRQALAWMNLVLYHPDWRPENLARIGDALDGLLGELRNTMQTPEGRWAQALADAWRSQDNPLMLAAGCFLTRAYNVHRLRWRLKDATPDARAAVSAFLADTAGLRGSREELKKAGAAKAAHVVEGARTLAAQAARDLEQLLPDIPDSSLAADWAYVCNEMRRDLQMTPAQTLAELDGVRRQILRAGGARMFMVGSGATQKGLGASIRELTAGLDAGTAVKVSYPATRHIEARLQRREPRAAAPVFVGLLNPNTQGGVFRLSAPAAGYADTDREALLDYLAANQYTGVGAHSLFTKTMDAGLAYNSGDTWQLSGDGRLYYSVRGSPELPQTLRFAMDVLKKTRPDAAIAEYAVAEAFRGSRAGDSYEWRVEAMANDLADGITPALVTRFRTAILELHRSPGLAEELHRRLTRVYARVMPGLGASVKDVPGGVYFIIGPEKQFVAWEQYLRTVEGPDTKVYRLYPRDFWME